MVEIRIDGFDPLHVCTNSNNLRQDEIEQHQVVIRKSNPKSNPKIDSDQVLMWRAR